MRVAKTISIVILTVVAVSIIPWQFVGNIWETKVLGVFLLAVYGFLVVRIVTK